MFVDEQPNIYLGLARTSDGSYLALQQSKGVDKAISKRFTIYKINLSKVYFYLKLTVSPQVAWATQHVAWSALELVTSHGSPAQADPALAEL